MFGWFKKNDTDGEFYKPKERQIYCYWNGKEDIKEDPTVIYRRIADVGPELKIDLTVAGSISKDAGKAEVKAIQKLQKIFEVKSFAEGGLTEEELWNLFSHFLDYRDRLKKNSSPSPISATATLGSSSSSSAESPPTESGLVSGSTEKEPCTDQAEPLPKHSQLDSAYATQE